MNKNELLHAIRKVAAFSIPFSAGAMINMATGFIAMMFVAQLGKEELAAGALSVSTFIMIMTVAATIFYAVSILISFKRSQPDTEREIGLIVKNSFWLAVFLSLPSSFILWHADKFLLLFRLPADLISITRGYFHFAALSMLPLLLLTVIAQFFSGIGKPKLTLFIALINLPLNALVAYGFVLGHFGLPKLGLAGITCANLIVQSVMLILVTLVLYFKDDRYQLFSNFSLPDLTVCKSVFTLGLPIGLQFGCEIAAMSCATYLMGHFGVIALAASQVVSQYALFAVMLTLGLSQALSILISEAYGNNNIALIRHYLHATLLMLVGYFIVIGVIFIFYSTELIRFFVGPAALTAELMELAKIFFILSVFMLFTDGIRNALSGALRGVHDAQAPMRIGVISLWFISLPACYVAGFTLHGGPIGLRAAFLSGFVIASIILYRRLKHKLHHIEMML